MDNIIIADCLLRSFDVLLPLMRRSCEFVVGMCFACMLPLHVAHAVDSSYANLLEFFRIYLTLFYTMFDLIRTTQQKVDAVDAANLCSAIWQCLCAAGRLRDQHDGTVEQRSSFVRLLFKCSRSEKMSSTQFTEPEVGRPRALRQLRQRWYSIFPCSAGRIRPSSSYS